MKLHQLRLLVLVLPMLLLMFYSSCEKGCQANIRVFGDMQLQDSALELTPILEPEQITFVDSSGNEFIVNRIEFTSRFIRESTGLLVCDEGGPSEGFYYAEERHAKYAGSRLEYSITLTAFTDLLARNEREIDLSKNIGQDYMEVEMIVDGCDTLKSLRSIQERGTNEPSIQYSIAPLRKFGQIHRDLFRLRSFSYEGDLAFTKENGLISFDYCNLSLVQLGERIIL